MLNKLMKQYTINIMKSFENHELELRSKIERKFRIKRKTKKKKINIKTARTKMEPTRTELNFEFHISLRIGPHTSSGLFKKGTHQPRRVRYLIIGSFFKTTSFIVYT